MPFPEAVLKQDRLLSLNVREEPGIDVGHLIPGMKLWPLFLDPENSIYVLYASYAPGTRMPPHFHTGTVHFYTVKGRWNYVEYPDDPQTAGSYLYEPASTVHSLSVPDDAEEDMEGFMVVNGANVNFDAEGNYLDTSHSGVMEQLILECAKRQGIGTPRYIRPSGKAEFTK